jgi:hypothetical protein
MENRRHPRAEVKWPVVILTPNGLVDGKTENLGLGGTFIRLSGQLGSKHNLPVVITVKGRFISCTAQVVWLDIHGSAGQNRASGIGVRFTNMMLNDRSFLHYEISNHL